jgi:hypothetical protein
MGCGPRAGDGDAKGVGPCGVVPLAVPVDWTGEPGVPGRL